MKADRNGHGGKLDGLAAADLSRQKSLEAHYEVSDVELRGIIVFLIGLTIMTVVVYFLMLLMFDLLSRQETQTDTKQRSRLALSEKDRRPPEPRLQSAPGFAEGLGKEVGVKEGKTSTDSGQPKDRTWELDQLQTHWADELQHGPKDANGNPAGISIDEAMKNVVSGSGLPVRTPATTQPGAGGAESFAVDMPTSASSGRMTEKRKQ